MVDNYEMIQTVIINTTGDKTLTAKEIHEKINNLSPVSRGTIDRCLRHLRVLGEINFKKEQGYANHQFSYWYKEGY